jgi:hypothetical protein
MPDRTSLYNDFFKAEDFKGQSRVVTIESEEPTNFAREGEPPDMRSVLYIKEDERGLPLNKTRYRELSEIFGTPNTDKWIGGRIEVFFDPDVKFGGRKVGGIAVRAAK